MRLPPWPIHDRQSSQTASLANMGQAEMLEVGDRVGASSLDDETSLVLGNKTSLKLDGASRVGKTSDGTETFKQQDGTGRKGGCSRTETRRGTGSMSLKLISLSRQSNSTKIPS